MLERFYLIKVRYNLHMEPANLNIEVQDNRLNVVTPLSKYLALILFIIMPFVGAWIGYTYAPEKIVETEKIVYKISEPISAPVANELDSFSPERVNSFPGSTETNNKADPSCEFATYRNDAYGFEFQYPACREYGARQNSIKSGNSFQIWKIIEQADINPPADYSPMASIFIDVEENPMALRIEEFYDGTPGVDLIGTTKPEERKLSQTKLGLAIKTFSPYVGLTGLEKTYIIDINRRYFISIFDRTGDFDVSSIFDTFKIY